jgi:hypothetical protein
MVPATTNQGDGTPDRPERVGDSNEGTRRPTLGLIGVVIFDKPITVRNGEVLSVKLPNIWTDGPLGSINNPIEVSGSVERPDIVHLDYETFEMKTASGVSGLFVPKDKLNEESIRDDSGECKT